MNEIIALHDTPDLQQTADAMEALGNETRLAVYTLLVPAGRGGLTVGAIQARLGVPASTLSHHLSRLIQVDLVEQERQGRKLICRANYRRMDAVLRFLTRNCCAADGIAHDVIAGHGHEISDIEEGSAA
ncbi:MAG: helix-turn-helix transcriptional regulator [Alphaproteobacteria bacterium]|mgnify:CR=1 FL=1|nr:helix-turn-helix transcriptional regulator [Alphaproteobacteria bacterium]